MKLFILHFFVFLILTVLTQTGGLIYLLTLLLFRFVKEEYKRYRMLTFTVFYLLITFYVVPYIAPVFGREKIKDSSLMECKHWFYTLTNRTYVTPEMHQTLQKVAYGMKEEYPGLKLIYMDASFPFIDGFPLLPHLYHNDGKKIDIALIYKNDKGDLTNRKPTISGYGYFIDPDDGDMDHVYICKSQGEWHYDFTKYFTFGKVDDKVEFSERGSASLLHNVLDRSTVERVFVEPHLQERLGLETDKIWYHGCQTVRHDDHIHLELK